MISRTIVSGTQIFGFRFLLAEILSDVQWQYDQGGGSSCLGCQNWFLCFVPTKSKFDLDQTMINVKDYLDAMGKPIMIWNTCYYKEHYVETAQETP